MDQRLRRTITFDADKLEDSRTHMMLKKAVNKVDLPNIKQGRLPMATTPRQGKGVGKQHGYPKSVALRQRLRIYCWN